MKLKLPLGLLLTFFVLTIILCLIGCQLGGPGKRVTTVTGRVIDEAQQPVENVRIFMTSIGFLNGGIPIGDGTFTDAEGNFTLVVDVPKEHKRVTIGISWDLDLSRKYKDFDYTHDGLSSGVCCPAQIGKKTNYIFTLFSK
ncbi:carboxypeptidase-like regulatory domain-containing protein [Arundinibacter roseus]|uniref:Carboxypeptidase regulatory-like domain-containing protein n=1 Tax=Arundinibacter roseus TaxID=2070510 RepID=A0A4V2X8E1_9BACT|nr:carboxypeptidase-like regulatory domain-containing protein [Arundinibacter roseus]TDB59515.1 carboxypeptidase regulatory-like domain-containing protein [Arundinibacter roseus]